MSFAWPTALAALALLAPLAWVLVRGERIRRETRDLFGAPALAGRWSTAPTARARAVGHGLTVAGLACGIIALARPQLGAAPRALHRSSGDVLFVLDLSRSMAASDVAPSRLAAAKRAAGAIARALPDDRVGLLVFGGSGFLQLPPTLDHATFRTFLDAAGTADIPDPSTNLEAAAGMIATILTRDDAPYSAAVLLSDGEDVEGKLEPAIRLLSTAGVRTSAVGVGTTAGTVLYDRDSKGRAVPHHDWTGREVTTRLVEQNLEDIARRTGGRYVRWAGEASLEPIVGELGQMRRRHVAGEVAGPLADRFQWPLALAFGALLAHTLLVRARPPRIA